MNIKKLLIGLFVTLAFWSISCTEKRVSNKDQLIPLEYFFRNPEKTNYQISPYGNYFSYTASYESRMNIYVQQIGSDSAVRVTNETVRDIANYYWVNDNCILFLKDINGDENFQLYGIDINENNIKALVVFPNVRTIIIDLLEKSDNEIIIGMNKRNPQVFDPYLLNVVTGELTQLAINSDNIQSWIVDNDGKLRLAKAIDGVNQILLYRDNDNEKFKPILTTNFKESFTPVVFTSDNKRLYALSNVGRDKTALVIFDPETAKEQEVLFEHPKYDITNISFSQKENRIKAVFWEELQYKGHKFFDGKYEALYSNLEKKLPDYQIDIVSGTRDESKMIVNSYNDKTKGSYYSYNVLTDELIKIADITPWLKEEDMNSVNVFTYQTLDGLTIEAYLTLPKGYTMETAKKLPIIVNPHGGPSGRNLWKFYSEAQFFANRGYAVFHMNFRGSSGLGRIFLEASYKQWGLKMQDDITDGVNWLIDNGIADPQRIAIYGISYGGYAALAGLAFTPDLYACGIDYVGVSNLFTLLESLPAYWKPQMAVWYETLGNPVSDSLQLAQTSPALNADKIKAPLFVAQGANDPRVNKAESDQMVEALKKRGVEVEYMVKENEGHMFKNEENRLDFYRTIEKFLAKHLDTKNMKK